MPRRPRFDAPGLLHHVMNRGIARRTVFERRADARYFLSLLAREVRAGTLRVHAFAILTTHFHLLVSTPDGNLSGVMRRVLNLYVRYFNRTRGRDGALFRGRFRSRPVMTERYRYTLIRYIDHNAVEARLACSAELYVHGSASLYAAERRPLWLDTRWVDERMGHPHPAQRARRYRSLFGSALTEAEKELVNARIQGQASLEDELDDLVDAAPPQVLAWMRRKAELADQTKPGMTLVGAQTILETLEGRRDELEALTCVPARRRIGAWPIVRVGLLRELGGMTYQQIARTLELPQSSAQVRARQHRYLVCHDADYANEVARVASECLHALDNP